MQTERTYQLDESGERIKTRAEIRRRRAGIIGGLAASVCMLIGGVKVVQTINDNNEHDEAYRQVQAPVAEQQINKDGFKVFHYTSPWIAEQPHVEPGNDVVDFKVDFDSCTVPITAYATKDADGNITDVHDYRFENNVSRIGAEFTFENQQQLEDNILGPEPCKALAQTTPNGIGISAR